MTSSPAPGPPTPPVVSVIVPTFNRADFLPRTLESLFALSYPDVEIVVVDDGSTDGTAGLLAGLADRPRLSCLRQANGGQASAVNRGFAAAAGRFLMVCNSDDPQPADLLEPLVETLEGCPEVALVYPDWDIIDENDAVLDQVTMPEFGGLLELAAWHVPLPGPGALFRREAVLAAGGWDITFRHCPDWEWYLRLALLAGPFRRVPGPRARWRSHGGSISNHARGEAMSAEMLRAVSTFFARPDLPAEVTAVRAESLRNAFIEAAHTVVPADFRSALPNRYRIADRFRLVRRPGEAVDETERRLDLEFEVERLHGEVATRDETVRWLHGEVAARDETVRRLHAEVTARDATIAGLRPAARPGAMT